MVAYKSLCSSCEAEAFKPIACYGSIAGWGAE